MRAALGWRNVDIKERLNHIDSKRSVYIINGRVCIRAMEIRVVRIRVRVRVVVRARVRFMVCHIYHPSPDRGQVIPDPSALNALSIVIP